MASFGLSLWDTNLRLSHVNKYTYSSEEYIKASVLLTTSILKSSVCTEAEVAKGLIGEYVDNKSMPLKTSTIMCLGLVYTDSHHEDLLQLLIPHISDNGSKNSEITGTILQTLVEKAERSDTGLNENMLCGLQDASDMTIKMLKAIELPILKTMQIVVEACVFAGMGNVLKV
ncbi:26S proteasome regulatory subunit RPN1 [Mycena venus]|uniref:26S proteasome regulatory subunit RPN1 n=1 Tax=Mycena venus TaxID=2733690 RepID=A0A8H6XRG9_9AGAR|nr:26S proteasome regulatory subunit RPN1 [Mycena venus]